MKATRVTLLLAAGAILVGVVACAGFSTSPTVSNIRMATDDTGKTPTSSYAPGDDFFVFADLSGLQVGSVVQAKWYAVEAEGAEPNMQLSTSDYSYESGIGFVYFQLSTSDGGDWPAGSYRVELLLNGVKVGEQGFTVR
jgi:hypothetical protein